MNICNFIIKYVLKKILLRKTKKNQKKKKPKNIYYKIKNNFSKFLVNL